MSPKEAKCRECGAPIYWAKVQTPNGPKNWSFDTVPSEKGYALLTHNSETGETKAMIFKKDDLGQVLQMNLPGTVKLRTPHFKTCSSPEAVDKREQWRSRNRKR
jgi:hypothetical protein